MHLDRLCINGFQGLAVNLEVNARPGAKVELEVRAVPEAMQPRGPTHRERHCDVGGAAHGEDFELLVANVLARQGVSGRGRSGVFVPPPPPRVGSSTVAGDVEEQELAVVVLEHERSSIAHVIALVSVMRALDEGLELWRAPDLLRDAFGYVHALIAQLRTLAVLLECEHELPVCAHAKVVYHLVRHRLFAFGDLDNLLVLHALKLGRRRVPQVDRT
mmetsp:Transcript_7036/g.19833  ORF Transcript_7036/g.19833 Transcript_7036/m.19833 type:complete len:217 (+) Transcript_7036:764-1414(+)